MHVPPHWIQGRFTGGERSDQTESINMEQVEIETSSNRDHDLLENTSRPKKVKRQK